MVGTSVVESEVRVFVFIDAAKAKSTCNIHFVLRVTIVSFVFDGTPLLKSRISCTMVDLYSQPHKSRFFSRTANISFGRKGID